MTNPQILGKLSIMSDTIQEKQIEEIIGNIKSINLGDLTESNFQQALIHTNNALESLEDVKVLVCEK